MIEGVPRNRRIVLSGFALLAIVAVAAGLAWWIDRSTSHNTQPYTPSQTSYMWGLYLGTTKNDVLFEKGEPDSKFIAIDKPSELWAYQRGVITYSLRFERGALDSITKENFDPIKRSHRDASLTDVTLSNELHGTDKGLLGIEFGDVPSTVTSYLGDPESVVETNEGARRKYNYKTKLNVSFVFEKGRVISMSVGGS